MNEQPIDQERMTKIPSKQLRALRADLKRLQRALDQESKSKCMLLYIMGWGGDKVEERDKLLIIFQEKVSRALAMLEDSSDPSDIINMLREKVDFCEAHPTFASGMNDTKGNI